MEMTIVYIVLIVLLLGIIWHIFCHLMVIFHQYTTDFYVKKALKDPYKYVRDEEMCYFIRNMVYLFFVCMLLFAACNGNIHFEKKTKPIEISNVKDKQLWHSTQTKTLQQRSELRYHEWLTPDQARKAVEIARDEMLNNICEWIDINYVY